MVFPSRTVSGIFSTIFASVIAIQLLLCSRGSTNIVDLTTANCDSKCDDSIKPKLDLISTQCPVHFATDVRSWPINLVLPKEEAGYCKEETDVCPSIFLPLNRVFAELSQMTPMSNFVVNIGGNDGKTGDPLYPVMLEFPEIDYLGFEPGPLIGQMRNNLLPFKNAVAVQESITPKNVVDLVQKYMKNTITAPDIIKIDTDGCDCHILLSLLSDSSMLAKIIQIELNHILPPPISYMDMCEDDVYGRSGGSLDVWGCSMQAAYDIVRKHGYVLLQYDWPDAVFIHSSLTYVFPCIAATGEDTFHRNYWTGLFHAKENYSRFHSHVSNKTFAQSVELLALRSHLHPRSTLEHIIATQEASWSKDPLWIELGIAGSSISTQIKRKGEEALRITWTS